MRGALGARPDCDPLDRHAGARRQGTRPNAEQNIRNGMPLMARWRPCAAILMTPPRRRRLGACRRPRLRAAAQALHAQCRRCDRRANLSGGSRHRAGGRTAVLRLPHHGRPWPLFHRAVRLRLLARGATRARAAALVPVARGGELAGAMDFLGAWLVRRRISAASPGRSRAFCRPSSPIRRSPPRASGCRSLASSSSTPALLIVDIYLLVRTIRLGPAIIRTVTEGAGAPAHAAARA